MDIGNNVLKNILGGKKIKVKSGGYIRAEGYRGRVAKHFKDKGWFTVNDVITQVEQIPPGSPERKVVSRQPFKNSTTYGYGIGTPSNRVSAVMADWNSKPGFHKRGDITELGTPALQSDIEVRQHPKNPKWNQYRIHEKAEIRERKK